MVDLLRLLNQKLGDMKMSDYFYSLNSIIYQWLLDGENDYTHDEMEWEAYQLSGANENNQ